MSISTKTGDTGFTATLGGERIPKYHVITESVGVLDEANALLGLTRARANDKRVRRVLREVQKHLFKIGAELSSATGKKQPKKSVGDTEVIWLEKLIDSFEEALSLPPGFVAFGQEKCSAQMDVARTAVRKAERSVVKMKSEGMIENPALLRYFNRLSDLLFLLACFEERSDTDRRKIRKAVFHSYWTDPNARKLLSSILSVILALIGTIILILIFHRPVPDSKTDPVHHMQGSGTEQR